MVRRHYGTVYRTGLAGELPNSFMTSVVSGTGETPPLAWQEDSGEPLRLSDSLDMKCSITSHPPTPSIHDLP